MKIIANTKLVNDIKHLPDDLSKDLEDYVDYLIKISYNKEALNESAPALLAPPKDSNGRGYGSLKGKIWISDDFDEPLAEFEDYM